MNYYYQSLEESERKIAEDWEGCTIYESDGERYFRTDAGLVLDDPQEVLEFMEATFGPSVTTFEMGLDYD